MPAHKHFISFFFWLCRYGNTYKRTVLFAKHSKHAVGTFMEGITRDLCFALHQKRSSLLGLTVNKGRYS